jgi:hypothetical protein
MSFLAVFKLFHVCIYNRFENTLISYHQNYYNSPVCVCVLFTHEGREGPTTWNDGLALQELKLAHLQFELRGATPLAKLSNFVSVYVKFLKTRYFDLKVSV